MFTPRDYQVTCRKAVLQCFREGKRKVLIVLPTGGGKTMVFSDIMRCLFPRRSMVLAHRKELIWQAHEKVKSVCGYEVDVEMGDLSARASNDLLGRVHAVVSSVQTQNAGNDGNGRMQKFAPEDFGLLVIDEAHHATSPSYRRIIDWYMRNPDLYVLGVTATPDRSDEESLGKIFDTVAFNYEIREAIDDGWLVPIKQQMAHVEIDLSGCRTTAGDLNGADLNRVMTAEKPLLGVADATFNIIGNRSTLVFTSSVVHAQMLCEIFNRYQPGVATWVCGETEEDERDKRNKKFKNGEIQILCNCGTHTEGFDSPRVEVVVMARPTKSRALYAQMVGRATRPLTGVVDVEGFTVADRHAAIAASGKPACLVLDFVGNAGRHKLMTTADLLGGDVSDEARENVIIRTRKNGNSDMRKELEEEEERLRKEKAEAARLEEERSRAKLKAKAKYTLQDIDPFALLNVEPARERAWDKGRQLTDKQYAFLERNGIDPKKHTFTQCKQLIGEIMDRFDKKLCTMNQAKLLAKYGLPTDVRMDIAKGMIDAIAANGWKKPGTWPEHFDSATLNKIRAAENPPEDTGSYTEADGGDYMPAAPKLPTKQVEEDNIPF